MRLIKLILDDGNPVAVNVPGIAYVQQRDAGSEIVFRRNEAEIVGEDFAARRATIAVTIELVLLTAADGAPIAVNPDAIAYVMPADDGGLIVFGAGASIVIRES